VIQLATLHRITRSTSPSARDDKEASYNQNSATSLPTYHRTTRKLPTTRTPLHRSRLTTQDDKEAYYNHNSAVSLRPCLTIQDDKEAHFNHNSVASLPTYHSRLTIQDDKEAYYNHNSAASLPAYHSQLTIQDAHYNHNSTASLPTYHTGRSLQPQLTTLHRIAPDLPHRTPTTTTTPPYRSRLTIQDDKEAHHNHNSSASLRPRLTTQDDKEAHYNHNSAASTSFPPRYERRSTGALLPRHHGFHRWLHCVCLGGGVRCLLCPFALLPEACDRGEIPNVAGGHDPLAGIRNSEMARRARISCYFFWLDLLCPLQG
jgi:hypothetical protein